MSVLPFFIFIAKPTNKKIFFHFIMPTFLNKSSPSTGLPKSTSSNMNDAVLSAEEEQGLYTQPEAEAVDLMVDLDSLKRKGITQVDNTSKKKQHPDVTDANLDAQMKQVSAFNANNSLLQAATIDEKGDTEMMSKKVTKYFTKPILGNKSSVWWEGFEQFILSKHPKLFSEYVMCLSSSKLGNNPRLGIVKIGLSQSTSNL
jgi:hypothetical protein